MTATPPEHSESTAYAEPPQPWTIEQPPAWPPTFDADSIDPADIPAMIEQAYAAGFRAAVFSGSIADWEQVDGEFEDGTTGGQAGTETYPLEDEQPHAAVGTALVENLDESQRKVLFCVIAALLVLLTLYMMIH